MLTEFNSNSNKKVVNITANKIQKYKNGEYEYEFENDLDQEPIKKGQFFSKFYLDVFCRHQL